MQHVEYTIVIQLNKIIFIKICKLLLKTIIIRKVLGRISSERSKEMVLQEELTIILIIILRCFHIYHHFDSGPTGRCCSLVINLS